MNHGSYIIQSNQAYQLESIDTTFIQSFEVVLTKGYQRSDLSDTEQVEKAYDNRENMYDIYKRVVNSRAGIPGTVLNITNLVVSEPEYLVDEKVAIQRATMDITYRFSLI